MADQKTISIRWRVYLALGLITTFLLLMAVLGASSMTQASYLLARASKSQAQLEQLAQLSRDINGHLVQQVNALLQGESTQALATSRQRIERQFQEMENLIHEEIALVQDAAEQADEQTELLRLARIRRQMEQLFDSNNPVEPPQAEPDRAASTRERIPQFIDLVEENLQPLIREAIADEHDEISDVESTMARLRTRLISLGAFLGLGSLAVALLASWQISRSLTRPIGALMEAAGALAAGHLNRRLPPLRRDELGQLAEHFNQMAAQLERQRLEMEQLNSELEQRVAERTTSLHRSNARLSAIDESRRRFLANVSHELRTPLTAILGELELSLQALDDRDSELAQSLRRINANGGYLRRRVQDLLLLARSEEGVLELQRQPVDLVALLRDVQQQMRGLADVEGITLRQCLGVPVAWAEVDPSWMGQCLMGLVDNAVKFSMTGGEVTVNLVAEACWWRIDVHDQGPGIEQQVLPSIFDRYFRSVTEHGRDGAGLGLAIAQWIVREHGGRIEAHNTHSGACIRLRLPRAGRNS